LQPPKISSQRLFINIITIHANLSLGLNFHVSAPHTLVAEPHKAYLAAGFVSHLSFVSNCSPGKSLTDNYYKEMMISRLKRQKTEEQKKCHYLEHGKRMAELELECRERDRRMRPEWLQKEKGLSLKKIRV